MAWTSKKFSIGDDSVLNLTKCGYISEAAGLNIENCITFSLQQWDFAVLRKQKWQKATILLMKTAFFLLRFQWWAWRWHKRSFLNRLFPNSKIFKIGPTCTGELNHYPRPVSLGETFPAPHPVPTLWADEQPLSPTTPQIKALSNPERGDALSLPSWFLFHIISHILGSVEWKGIQKELSSGMRCLREDLSTPARPTLVPLPSAEFSHCLC